MEFPALVYKDKGPHQRPGGSYNSMLVSDNDELNLALDDGWFANLADAINPPENEPPPIEEDNSPPTRAELESKATELCIKFDGRTPDRKLLELINDKL